MIARRTSSFGRKIAGNDARRAARGADASHSGWSSDAGAAPDSPLRGTPGDFDAEVRASRARQEERRRAIEADLRTTHGVSGVEAFHIVSNAIYRQSIGTWLIQALNLVPHDDWNVLYLPTDQMTAAVMDLPLHPKRPMSLIDALIIERLEQFRGGLEGVHRDVAPHLGTPGAARAIEAYLLQKDQVRRDLLDYAARLRPLLIDLLSVLQRLVSCP